MSLEAADLGCDSALETEVLMGDLQEMNISISYLANSLGLAEGEVIVVDTCSLYLIVLVRPCVFSMRTAGM